MKTLADIVKNIEIEEIHGNLSGEVSQISFNSKNIAANGIFAAVNGVHTDGHNYIESAITNGATAILLENMPSNIYASVTYIRVKSVAKALGLAACNFYGNPSEKLKLVGVTGTNGKTTIAGTLYNAVREMGINAGLISTVVYKINDRELEATHTTPDQISLNKLLAEMVAEGCEFAFMEVSSHAIDQHRIAGLQFAGGIFTNLTHDHLDYHKTFKNYIEAKKKFFDFLPKTAFALYNIDDRNGEIMVQNCKATKKSFGLKNFADFHTLILEKDFEGMLLSINGTDVWVRFTGAFNASNLTAVVASLKLLGFDFEEILTVVSKLTPIAGRFETVKGKNKVTAIVDYAHTPDALENVLSTIKDIDDHARLIVLVGAGGDRDKTKRPEMARIAEKFASVLILTSDNPRTEKPEQIIEDMKQGLQKRDKALIITDRKEAIKTACMMANSGDIILIPGKGHEPYQEIMGVKYPFNDKTIVNEFLNN